MRYVMYILLMGIFIPNYGFARPVSYPGGVTAMTQNNGDMNSVHLHYSPTAKYSLGIKGEYWREGGYSLQAVQMNNLIKRWNNPKSQANFYIKSGIGATHKDGDVDPAAFTGIAVDWEDRQYFISYHNRYTKAGDIDDFYQQAVHVGIAPYVGDYGDVHTWLMVEVEHQPEADKNITVTPMIRLFKGVHLGELGMSNQGDVLFNYVIRY